MKRKIGFYLFVALFVTLISSKTVYASEETVSEVTGKNGLEPVVFIELTDDEEDAIEALDDACTKSEHYISQEEREYWLQFSSDYYYENYLNDAEKQFWNALTEKALEMVSSKEDYGYYNNDEDHSYLPNNAVDIDPSISWEKMIEIIYAFQYANPQFYFISNHSATNASKTKLYLLVYKDFADGETRAQCTMVFRMLADIYLEYSADFTTEEEKVRYVHDIICKNTVYERNSLDQSAYSMLVLHKTVCAGYSKGMSMFLNAMGIDCFVMLGPDHGWNAVKLHDVWYELDATWDDLDDEANACNYKYFNKSSITFKQNGHVKREPYASMDLGANYDSLHDELYKYSYVQFGGNTYFVVNGNPYLDFMMVKRVSGTAPLAQTINHLGLNFFVFENVQQVKAFVERMYTIVLGRAAETQGMIDWSYRLLTQEIDGATLVDMFVNSDEFINRNTSDEEYIKILYRAVLGREADADGLKMWKDMLADDWTRDYILEGLVLSTEFKNICDSYGIIAAFEPTAESQVRSFVKRMYTVVLNRRADVVGLNEWTQRLMNGTANGAQLADGFISSDEFVNRNLSNEKYVKVLYRAFFNREPDEGGFNVWMNELAKGTSRRDVMKGFVHSVEFSDLCAQYGIIRGEVQ